MVRPVDRHRPQAPQHRAERALDPPVLDHPLHVEPDALEERHQEETVPVAGVGHREADGAGREPALELPAGQVERRLGKVL